MKVPAHTSRYGYHTRTEYVNYDYGDDDKRQSAVYDAQRPVKTAISNRPLPVKGNKSTPKSYYRKIARLWSLNKVDVTTMSHYYIADQSFGYRGITLYEWPYGSPYTSSTVSLPNWMTNKAIQDCINRLQDVRANIMEDLGQSVQTVNMCWNIFRNIVDLFLLMMRRRWRAVWRKLKRRPKRVPKDASQAWLMYYYGIAPMVGTIAALCGSRGPRFTTCRRRVRVRNPVDITGFVDGSLSIRAESGKAEQLAQCGMTIKVRMSDTLAYWNSLGLSGPFSNLGTKDALVTLWALTPYSFVLDWILPVERFLSTRLWGSGIVYQNGYVTKVLTGLGVVVETNPMTGIGDTGILPRCRVGCMQMQRIAYNSYAPPSGLALNLSLTSTQAFNAMALIAART